MARMLAAGIGVAAIAGMAYAVRGRSSTLLGPSVYHGSSRRRTIALTFDDGPSESTPALLDVLAGHGVRATFFQCGANIRRLPELARAVRDAGHEIGNHSDTHPAMYFKSPSYIRDEFERAQRTIGEVLQVKPRVMRAPFGVRWIGFRAMQRDLGLTGVMWTVIGNDWDLPADKIVLRVTQAARNGAIVCLHDGRNLALRPNIANTIEAVRILIPLLAARGFAFETVSQMICPTI